MGPESNLKTDEELMLEYQEGNELAFEVLYSRYSRKVYGFLYKKIYDKNRLDDIFQTTFMKLHQSRSQYDPSHPFAAWMFVICRSVMTDHLRKAHRTREVPSSDTINQDGLLNSQLQSEELHIHDAFHDSTHESLNLLSEKQRKAVQMRYLEDLDFEVIAKKLNTTSTNARKLVSRGILELKTLVKGR